MQSTRSNSASTRASLEDRIAQAPQLVVSHIRLARLLEEEGDLQAAAAALQDAYFFLPNGPAVLDGLRRLSRWSDTRRKPVSVATTPPQPEADATEDDDEEGAGVEPEAVEPAMEDELDQLIEGLGKARLGEASEAPAPPENEWSEDDGLIATETLAHIFESQSQFAEALSVYERLLKKEGNPERAAALREKAAGVRRKLRDSN